MSNRHLIVLVVALSCLLAGLGIGQVVSANGASATASAIQRDPFKETVTQLKKLNKTNSEVLLEVKAVKESLNPLAFGTTGYEVHKILNALAGAIGVSPTNVLAQLEAIASNTRYPFRPLGSGAPHHLEVIR